MPNGRSETVQKSFLGRRKSFLGRQGAATMAKAAKAQPRWPQCSKPGHSGKASGTGFEAILYDHLCKISVCGPLVEDLSVRISAAGSCRTTCARLYQHFVRWTRTISADGCTSKPKKAISPAFRALDTYDLRRGLHFEIKKRNFTCIPRTRHARSPQRVHISKPCFRNTAPATKS